MAERLGGTVARGLPGLAVLAALLACSDPDPRCADVTGQIPGTLSLGTCSDGHRREVSCTRSGPADDWTCACLLAGSVGRSFNWPAKYEARDGKGRRELEDTLRRQCHWSLRLR